MSYLNELINNYPELEVCREDINKAFIILKECFQQDNKLLVCGNGGSAADAEHIVGELMKGFLKKRSLPDSLYNKLKEKYEGEGEYIAKSLQQALPAISLVSHTALMTAFNNDVAADLVFAQQVYGYGQPGDVLLGISTSGNSRNVVNALKIATVKGLKTIGLTGGQGGEMKEICDCTIIIPEESTPQIQERHLPVYHTICAMLEEEFFQ